MAGSEFSHKAIPIVQVSVPNKQPVVSDKHILLSGSGNNSKSIPKVSVTKPSDYIFQYNIIS